MSWRESYVYIQCNNEVRYNHNDIEKRKIQTYIYNVLINYIHVEPTLICMHILCGIPWSNVFITPLSPRFTYIYTITWIPVMVNLAQGVTIPAQNHYQFLSHLIIWEYTICWQPQHMPSSVRLNKITYAFWPKHVRPQYVTSYNHAAKKCLHVLHSLFPIYMLQMKGIVSLNIWGHLLPIWENGTWSIFYKDIALWKHRGQYTCHRVE